MEMDSSAQLPGESFGSGRLRSGENSGEARGDERPPPPTTVPAHRRQGELHRRVNELQKELEEISFHLLRTRNAAAGVKTPPTEDARLHVNLELAHPDTEQRSPDQLYLQIQRLVKTICLFQARARLLIATRHLSQHRDDSQGQSRPLLGRHQLFASKAVPRNLLSGHGAGHDDNTSPHFRNRVHRRELYYFFSSWRRSASWKTDFSAAFGSRHFPPEVRWRTVSPG